MSAPFLHFSWAHIEGNSGPLFIFGFLAAYRGVRKFIGVTILVVLVSGLAAWFTASAHSVGAGASGVVFGYFGYIMVRGFFDRHPLDMLIGAVMALCFAYQFSVLLPHAGIGWQAHVGGLLAGGLLTAAYAYAPRQNRALIQAGATVAVVGVLVLAILGVSHVPGEEKTVSSRWEKEIQAFEKKDKDKPPPANAVLFVGSSSIRLWNLATSGNYAEALKIYRWYTPLLHLDTHVKLVQYIKLTAAECGYGTETTRAPRLPLVGREREEVLAIIRKAIATRP